jgi:beta-glucosidase-like glycosyl hydrolase
MGRQAKSKGVQSVHYRLYISVNGIPWLTTVSSLVLAPTVNIHRSPLGGRNFEAFSEDPHLSGYLASNLVSGVQAEGVGATVKHFVCNDVETDRTKVDVRVHER